MSFGKVITLNTGRKIPQIGLGTWLSKPNEVENAVEIAVRSGYRHLDLARVYENQDEVGRALKKVIPSVVRREDLFITSKLWNSAHQPDQVEPALDETLQQLGVDYLDLYLVHWPVAFEPGNGLFPTRGDMARLDMETSLVDTWNAMIKLLSTGKVKDIGVSNFTIPQLQGIIGATGVVPVVNQIEAHPHLLQDDLVAYCKVKNIHLIAYSPLGNNLIGLPLLTEHPIVKEAAERLGASPAQVLIAWGVYRGYSVIPKSVHEERIVSNFHQIELNKECYERITSIGVKNHKRFNIPITYSPKWDINVFDEPIERTATHKVKIV
ncbi:NADP-dependent oxidoreductase domain-containing protein [Pisolithus croceorrhizus]|nr:NADP-dependent oxidoreductase domain-containing protein [Pisolithus croceorrhizus]KAI6125521.1 NADP-dependent oxidoreductase domain-containing protein [Pisolithus croceorrhizus]